MPRIKLISCRARERRVPMRNPDNTITRVPVREYETTEQSRAFFAEAARLGLNYHQISAALDIAPSEAYELETGKFVVNDWPGAMKALRDSLVEPDTKPGKKVPKRASKPAADE